MARKMWREGRKECMQVCGGKEGVYAGMEGKKVCEQVCGGKEGV